MRIFIVDTYYPAFLNRTTPIDQGSPMRHTTSSGALLWIGSSGRAMHTRTTSVNSDTRRTSSSSTVSNCKRAWAREHGVKPERRFGPPRDLSPLLEQVEEFRPDVVYVQDLNVLGPGNLRDLRTHAQLLAGQIPSAAPSMRRLALYDLLVTSFPHFVRRFRADGIASEYLRLGFDSRVLEHLPNAGATNDVVFVGALGALADMAINA